LSDVFRAGLRPKRLNSRSALRRATRCRSASATSPDVHSTSTGGRMMRLLYLCGLPASDWLAVRVRRPIIGPIV